MKHYKMKTCQKCGKEYLPTSPSQKWCLECIPEMTAKTRSMCRIRWKDANPEKVRTQDKRYRKEYPQRRSLANEKWHRSHPEYVIERRKSHSKSKAIRRALGFIPMNQSFDGCEAHHLDHDRVVYIPAELHKSISHNGRTGHNMDQINALALQWLAQNP